MTLQERLRTFRAQISLSIEKMANELTENGYSITFKTISGYESGKSYPSADTLIKLANILYTSTDYLLGRVDSDRPINFSTSDLTDDECNLLYSYRNLSKENKLKLEGFVEALKNN